MTDTERGPDEVPSDLTETVEPAEAPEEEANESLEEDGTPGAVPPEGEREGREGRRDT
jgi:hypothetical protein